MSGALVTVAKNPSERNLSWGEVDWFIETAVSEMRSRNYRPERIIPIGGGGIIPASIMAYRFYKKDHIPVEILPPVYAKSYDHENRQHNLQIRWPEWIDLYNKPTTLFVDDIVDSGATYEAVRSRMPSAQFFALVTKIVGHPYFSSTRDVTGYWWNFPWEKVPQEPKHG
jgi:hypoxanthine phosphoribosyltransferase